MINKINTESRRSVLFAAILLAMSSIQLIAQENPYQVIYDWGELPGGRPMGVVTGVQPDPDGEHIWVLERCSANQCAGSDLHPRHKLDMQGNTISSIGGVCLLGPMVSTWMRTVTYGLPREPLTAMQEESPGWKGAWVIR